jgi:hypothetical protein
MVNRTRDIVNLREAARRCRSTAAASQGARAATFEKLAEEIDALILSLMAEIDAGRAAAAAQPCGMTGPDAADRASFVRAMAG